MSVWSGTPFERLYNEFMQSPTHRAVYYIGLIDQSIADVFGVLPESDDAPEEARQVANIMMQALVSGVDMVGAIESARSIVDAWRRSAN